MPSRYAELDSDEERLPHGMTRIGYDADTQVYTFRDADGELWEAPPGSRYGHLTKVGNGPKPPSDLENIDVEAADSADQPPPYDDSEATQPFLNHRAQDNMGQGWGGNATKKHWRAELMPLLNFFLILALSLMGLFWFLGWMAKSPSISSCGLGSHAHQIQQGETCWSVANMHGIDLDRLKEANGAIDCDLLWVGQVICVPAAPRP